MTVLDTLTYTAPCSCGRIEISILENGDIRINGATAGTCKAHWINIMGALLSEIDPDKDTLRRFAAYIADIQCHKETSCAAAIAQCIAEAVDGMEDEQ